MSDIEKLVALAEHADEFLSMAAEIKELRAEVRRLKQPKALSSKEAAEVLNVTSATVVNWVNEGLIPGLRSRAGYRIPSDKIFAIAEQEAQRRREELRVVTQ